MLSEGIARLDIFVTHSLFVRDKKRCKPHMVAGKELHITSGRHPVIEEYLAANEQFIANDVRIGNDDSGTLHIITGPNMGGKSTFLRQNALIVLLAHCGLYVPAQKADVPLID